MIKIKGERKKEDEGGEEKRSYQNYHEFLIDIVCSSFCGSFVKFPSHLAFICKINHTPCVILLL
jgi:hypothetical protein